MLISGDHEQHAFELCTGDFRSVGAFFKARYRLGVVGACHPTGGKSNVHSRAGNSGSFRPGGRRLSMNTYPAGSCTSEVPTTEVASPFAVGETHDHCGANLITEPLAGRSSANTLKFRPSVLAIREEYGTGAHDSSVRRHGYALKRHSRSTVAAPDRQRTPLRQRNLWLSLLDQPPPYCIGRTHGAFRHGLSCRQRVREDVVTKCAWQHTIANRIERAHQCENPPQRAHVFSSGPFSIPLIESAVPVFFISSQPQFRDKSGKANEKRCVEKAFGPKQGVCTAMNTPQSECYDEDNRVGRGRSLHDGFPVDDSSCAVRESHFLPYALCRLTDAALGDEVHRPCNAAEET